MPPKKDEKKKKKKKKTKAELEEEARLAEEAARLAEEERLRQEAEERRRAEELEAQRQALLDQLMAWQNARLEEELAELDPLMSQFEKERRAASERAAADLEWTRFLRCTPLPHPLDRVAMNDYLNAVRSVADTEVQQTLKGCEDIYEIVQECCSVKMRVLAEGGPQTLEHAKLMDESLLTLYDIINQRMDHMTAHILLHADQHANERNEIQLAAKESSLQWGLWVNTSKNPRLKIVEMSQLGLTIDIPKQIALASIAVRVQRRSFDELFHLCQNEYMSVGGVFYVDLLTLPPPARRVKSWVLRQITPLAFNVQRLPYPIPPAGADPLTYRSEEEPPPLGFSYPLSPNLLLMQEPVQVGWWDAEHSCWSTSGISEVVVNHSPPSLSFHTTHLAPLAVILPRTRLLPYKSWSVRPTGGKNGTTAAVTLQLPALGESPVVLEVGPGWTKLTSPRLPELTGLLDRALPPRTLLLQLSQAHGLHLMPEDRDASFAGVVAKERDVEEAMCRDLALICGVFLVSGSKWNQSVGAGEALCRISEVTDWEEGGRTELHHVERIFSKEREEGERRVLAIIRRGVAGVAWSDALDKRETYPPLPGHETVESVQSCFTSIFGEVHASLLSLMQGTKTPELQEDPNWARLQASPEALALVSTTDPLFTATLAQLLAALRVFSFS